MIELKVHCDCGQKYKFDVEPVNNQMPFTVACPICKRDGTPKANVLLQQMSVFKRVDAAPAPMSIAPAPVLASAAPPPVAPAPIAPIAAPPAGPSRLRINAHAEVAAPATIAPVADGTPPPIGARPRMGAMAAAGAVADPEKKSSFAMGLLGAAIGALVGGAIYFAVYKITGPFFLLRYVLALGVGGLTGWLANLLGKGEGSKELGGLAAVLTIVAIVGAQYFLELQKWHADMDLDNTNQAIADGGYANSVKEAKKVVAVIPAGTDAQIRLYLARE
ncbi:MAG TPA: hypothetical protein VH251_07455, partial [Verrucomicrobiae bacterium]|nr:hypothetical protein [Verrucomicrobiae bacterium]